MNQNEIEIHKDDQLLELTQKMALLNEEEVEFFFGTIKKRQKVEHVKIFFET